MAAVCNIEKTCRDCKENCFLSHYNNTSNSTVLSFFKSMDAESCISLEIPSPYAEQIQSDGCRFALLEGPNGCLWDAILCCCDTSVVAFRDGWKIFVIDHSIQPQDIIVFRYVKNAHFLVQIFESDGIEKQMANNNREMSPHKNNLEETACSLDKPDVSCEVQGPNPKSSSPEVQGPNPKSSSPEVQDLGPPKAIKRGELRFSKVMVRSAVSSTSTCRLHIPLSFARCCLPRARVEVVLLYQRRRWQVTYIRDSSNTHWFGHGWKLFVLDNQVKVGDTCLFELEDTENHVFTVKISRA